MRIFFPSGFNINLKNFLQRLGYSLEYKNITNRISFVRRLTSDYYPHFHIYLEKDISGKSYFSLHLDQKKTSYSGFHSHNAEYTGKIVENESMRIKEHIFKIFQTKNNL